MAVLRITGFAGNVPVMGERALPDNFGIQSVNTWLYGAELRGIRPPMQIEELLPTTRKVLRIPETTDSTDVMAPSTWVQFQDPDTDIVKGGLVEDSYQRWYFCSPTKGLMFNTYARMQLGQSAYRVGAPGPSTVVDANGDNAWKPIISKVNAAAPMVEAGELLQEINFKIADEGNGTSYSNPGGEGDRRATIVVGGTMTFTIGASSVAANNKNLINGNIGETDFKFTNINAKNRTLSFDFGVGAKKVIDEFTWLQSTAKTYGVFYWQGSQNGTTWDDIGGSLTLGGGTTTVYNRTNTTGFRFYRLSEQDRVASPNTTRAYLYTWVNEYGEESSPSLPAVGSGPSDGTWTISNIKAPPASGTEQPLWVKKRLYRTLSGKTGQTTYYLVVELPLDTTTWVDDTAIMTDTILAGQLTLPSTNWAPPPWDTATGVSSISKANPAMVTVGNIGMLSGSSQVTIAGGTGEWAAVNGTHTMSTIIGNTFTIPVNTSAFTTTMNAGITAISVTPRRLKGIIAMPNGFLIGFDGNNIYMSEAYQWHAWPSVYKYATETPIVGLGVIGQTCVVCTEGYPSTITGSRPGSCSFAKVTTGEPCMRRSSIVSTPQGVLYASQNGLMLIGPGGISNVTQKIISKDEWGKDYSPNTLKAVRYQNGYLALQYYTSKAHEGFFLDPTELRVALTDLSDFHDILNLMVDVWSGDVLMLRGNGVDTTDLLHWDPPSNNIMPLQWLSKEFQFPYVENFGAYSIYWDSRRVPSPPVDWGSDIMAPTDVVRLKVYAGINNTVVYDQPVPRNGQPVRLPSGFKSDIWRFEIKSRAPIYSLHVASTVKELRDV